ncbi:LPXTG cell wall anchor domain-containing protein [Herbiconiux sp. CPCC 205716]|uniref:LPXTG cell wall anchor domain-containing protein n=1 Tax=Herbiconiux gentiana TaxID=2970912 RepID=A0ABT2GHE9_9MICO|nr:LPXTG cell wall anchor domain-containing protein [Herbiconiux gentiana]MCS5715644.1 LPXTG cell wall anchor domain-containing protein [Herbiconiux gentiana]
MLPRRSEPSSVRRPVYRIAAAGIALAALVGAGFAAAPASAASPDKAVTPVELVDDTPSLPNDALGSSAASSVVQSDMLLARSPLKSTQAVLKATSSMETVTTQATGSETVLPDPIEYYPDLVQQYPTASGRFTDAGPERVLDAQLVDAGGIGLLTLRSPSVAVEALSLAASAETPVAGSTYRIESASGVVQVSGDQPSDTLPGGTYVGGPALIGADPQTAAAPASNWAVQDVGDSAVQIVNQLTGMCLTGDPGSLAVTTAPCGGFAAGLQRWAVSDGPDGLVLFGGGSVLQEKPDGSGYALVDFESWSAGPSSTLTFTEVQQPGGVVPSWSAPNYSKDLSLPFDLAVGDLDRAVDADGNYHDEAALAYVDENHVLNLAIVDYNAPGGFAVTPVAEFADGPVGVNTENGYASGSIGVEVGDFDGNGADEIAVMSQGVGAFGAVTISFVSYESPGSADVLANTASPSLFADGGASYMAGLFDTAAGDFDGGGRSQFAVAYHDSGSLQPTVEIMSFAADWTLDESVNHPLETKYSDASGTISDFDTWTNRGLRLESAILQVDATGAGYDSRQLVLGFSGLRKYDNGWLSQTIVESCFAGLALASGAVTELATQCVDQSDQPITGENITVDLPPLQLAAGGFDGRGSGSTLPTWGFATSVFVGGSTEVVYFTLSGSSFDQMSSTVVSDGPVMLTALDYDNSSLRLGAPLVLDVDSYQDVAMIAAQPPSHVDWLYDASSGTTEFINISSNPDLALTMSDSTETAYTSSSSSQVGGSVSVSASASVGATVKAGVGAEKASASLDVTGTLTGTVSHNVDDLSGFSSSKSVSTTSKTESDDLLRVKTQSQRVYRYPVLGGAVTNSDGSSACEAACYAYYDVYVPSSELQLDADVPGRAVDWYQPTWQNNNVLSYPTGPLEEPGAYSYVDDNGDTVSAAEYLIEQSHVLGGTSGVTALTITGGSNSSHTSTTSGTLGQGVEVKQSANATASQGLASESARESVDVSVNLTESFGGTTTGTTATSSTSGFQLDAPPVARGGYGFTTYYYFDDTGTPKVNYSVDLTQGDPEFWTRTYGQQADPALNLPGYIDIDYDDRQYQDVPKFSTEFSRQQIRGFDALIPSAAGNDAATAYASSPAAGNQVVFGVDVHNYSLVSAQNTTVEFFAVPVDETYTPVGPAQQIGGPQSVPSLAGQGSTRVYSDQWTAVGNSTSAALNQDWNIFVVLNSDGEASEIHPWQATTANGQAACPTTRGDDDFESAAEGTVDTDGFLLDPMTNATETLACGQNNQGFGTVTVTGQSSSIDAGEDRTSNVRLAGAGFATGEADDLTLTETSAVPTVKEGVPTIGLVRVASDTDSSTHQRVLVYDGDPDQGGRMLASTTLRGSSAEGGGVARFSWTPTGPGVHQLYQKVVGASSAGTSDAQIVTVEVVAATPEPTPTASPTPSAPASPRPSPEPSTPASGASPAGQDDGGPLAYTGQTVPWIALAGAIAALAVGGWVLRARRRRTSAE